MGIRLFVKNQPAQTVKNYDTSKPIDQVGSELAQKARMEIAKGAIPAAPPLPLPVMTTKKATEAQEALEEFDAFVAAQTNALPPDQATAEKVDEVTVKIKPELISDLLAAPVPPKLPATEAKVKQAAEQKKKAKK